MDLVLLSKEDLLIELNKAMRQYAEQTLTVSAYDKFYNVFVSPEDAAKIHGVNKVTVINYIKDGFIETEPHGEGERYRIRLSTVLKLDFKELKKKLKKQ
jgi:hypothetical protein